MRMITAAALAVVGVVAAVTTSVAGPASAAPTTVRPVTVRPVTVRSAVPLTDELSGVACRTAKNCLAVGTKFSATGPLAETWNGSGWRSISVKLPAGTPGGVLNGVTCLGTSGKKCITVGESFPTYAHGLGFALGDIWNGKAWASTQVAMTPITWLSSVSCLSPKSCLAVGGSHSPEGGYGFLIAYAWNGTKWKPLSPPSTGFNYGNTFTGVSCVAGSYCIAVGYAPDPATHGSGPLSYRWNGKAWTVLKPVTPTGVTDLMLSSVSCTTPKSCLAVGNGSGTEGNVAEMWNGKAWTATGPIGWPTGATYPSAVSVSCTTPSFCVTVGFTRLQLFGAPSQALASVWNGKTWTATPVAAPGTGKASQFSGVTCLRATFCVAVGHMGPYASTTGTGLSGFWNGKSWHLVAAK